MGEEENFFKLLQTKFGGQKRIHKYKKLNIQHLV